MIRFRFATIQRWISGLSLIRRMLFALVFLITVIGAGGLANIVVANDGLKPLMFIVYVCLLLVLSALSIHTYVEYHYEENTANDPVDTKQQQIIDPDKIPQRPEYPPTISAEKHVDNSSDEFEITDDYVVTAQNKENPSLYRHRFSIKPVIFKIFIAVCLWVGFVIVAITQNSEPIWWILVALTVLITIYTYYLLLRWRGEEFVVNDTWFERPLTMPFPFPSRTPAIRRSEIGKYEFKQSALDKLIDTCGLYSDTPSPDDKSFHNVKWLTHPAELRRATGISAPRKNSWLAPFRKDKAS